MKKILELVQSMKLVTKTGLAVGFPDAEALKAVMGGEWRAIRVCDSFPYEDGQFGVVVMAPTALNAKSAREAHRVLRGDGYLLISVPEKTKSQMGFSLADIYSVIREGYNIIALKRPAWWLFGRGGRTITICAKKKSWKVYKGFKRDGAFCLSPFQNSTLR